MTSSLLGGELVTLRFPVLLPVLPAPPSTQPQPVHEIFVASDNQRDFTLQHPPAPGSALFVNRLYYRSGEYEVVGRVLSFHLFGLDAGDELDFMYYPEGS